MYRQRRQPTPPHLAWSYSKYRSLSECPLKFYFEYVLRWKRPQVPILTVGSALHYMACRFFRTNYKSADSFCGAWAHFWLSVCDGKHGPSGFRDLPVRVNWKFEKEQYYWLNRGREVLTSFFERHASDRGTGMARMAERRFRIPNWRGLTLTGVLDRIDEYDDHVEVVDYKMGIYPPYMLSVRGSYQPTFYQLAYDILLAKYFQGKPLTSVRIENLFTGASQQFDIRAAEDIDDLYRALLDASVYVQAITNGRMPPDAYLPRVRRFPVDAEGRYVLWPHLPRDPGHCNTCPFTTECEQWEAEHRQDDLFSAANRLWSAHRAEEFRDRHRSQLILDLNGL